MEISRGALGQASLPEKRAKLWPKQCEVNPSVHIFFCRVRVDSHISELAIQACRQVTEFVDHKLKPMAGRLFQTTSSHRF